MVPPYARTYQVSRLNSDGTAYASVGTVTAATAPNSENDASDTGRVGRVERLTMYVFATTATIQRHDRVQVDDGDPHVVADVRQYESPFTGFAAGWPEVKLERVVDE